MTTEIELHQGEQNGLAVQMEYARALAAGSMLPTDYRDKPANILIAVGLGQSMGLSPAESLYRISVIKGKPTASAELVAANVRKAGHRLRVTTDEQTTSATATIVRADDPEFEFTVTRDMGWAKQMGLSTNDNYRKQPLTMLANRAITAAARLACPEALYGVAYTSDEMYDGGGFADQPAGGLAGALQTSGAAPGDSTPAEPVSAPPPTDTDEPAAPEPLTDRTRGAMFALFAEHGITERDGQLAYIADTLGIEVGSRADLTETDGLRVEAALRAEAIDAEVVPDAEVAALDGQQGETGGA